MQEMGIAGICPDPNLCQCDPHNQVYPYLLRGLAIPAPKHVWGIDITHLREVKGWMYLVALLDWSSRYVVSWELEQRLELPFVHTAVQRALNQARPTIMTNDQGSHFACPAYLGSPTSAVVGISMDGKGRATDNIFTERLWRSLKTGKYTSTNTPTRAKHLRGLCAT